MEAAMFHWVVQRGTQTGTLITFKSFADYADALRHKVELETISDPSMTLVAIESLPVGESPK
jgi:hypothetical protein